MNEPTYDEQIMLLVEFLSSEDIERDEKVRLVKAFMKKFGCSEARTIQCKDCDLTLPRDKMWEGLSDIWTD